MVLTLYAGWKQCLNALGVIVTAMATLFPVGATDEIGEIGYTEIDEIIRQYIVISIGMGTLYSLMEALLSTLEMGIGQHVHPSLHQVIVKPCHSLVKSLLLGISLQLDLGIATHCKPVMYTREEVDLVRLPDLGQSLLRLMSLILGEDVVEFRGSDGQRSGDGFKLFLLDEGRVRDKADVDAVLEMADDVLNAHY